MSCATEKCDDPNCGPCTIYERFPLLKKLQARSGQPKRTKVRPLLREERGDQSAVTNGRSRQLEGVE